MVNRSSKKLSIANIAALFGPFQKGYKVQFANCGPITIYRKQTQKFSANEMSVSSVGMIIASVFWDGRTDGIVFINYLIKSQTATVI